MDTITGRVIAFKRAGYSNMGNPAFLVTLQKVNGDHEILKTSANSSIAYEITNPNFKTDTHTFVLTARGLIRHALKVPKCDKCYRESVGQVAMGYVLPVPLCHAHIVN